MSDTNVTYFHWLTSQQSKALAELSDLQRYLYQMRDDDQSSSLVVGIKMALEAQHKVVALWKKIDRAERKGDERSAGAMSEQPQEVSVAHGANRWHEECVGTGNGDQPVMSCSGLTLCGVRFANADVRSGKVKLLSCTPRELTCPACKEALGG